MPIAGRLLAGSLQGGAAVALVWLICRRFRAIPASARAQAWWLVSLGLLLSLLTLPSLRVPLLPAPAPHTRLAAMEHMRDHPREPSNAGLDSDSHPWVNALIVLWLAGVLVHAYRLGSAYALVRGAVRRSTPLTGDDSALANRAAAAVGLTHTPRIRLSDEIKAPLVTGIVRPVVLVPPAAFDSLPPYERVMVICHELAHIRRRDLLFAWVPAIAERIFFFHPLARLAAREYAAERESACDAIVLNTMDVAPLDYARMLVRLGVGGLNPVLTVGGSSPSVSALKRRIDMLHDSSSMRPSRATIALVVLIAVLAVVPLRLVARAAAAPQDPAPQPSSASAQTARPNAPTKSDATPAPTPAPAPAPTQAPREPARSLERERAKVEDAVAEHQRDIQRLLESLNKLQSELEKLAARDRETQLSVLRQQANAAQESANVRELVERQRESVDGTKQSLDKRIHALDAERESLNLRQRQIDAEIEALRKQLESAR